MTVQTQYMSQDKLNELNAELKQLKEEKITALAKRIDEAKQMGDLSENAEYQTAREDMAWAKSRVGELNKIIDNSEIIAISGKGDVVTIGSTIKVLIKDLEKEYIIVGPQEANPLKGKISNESPLGNAFLGKKKGDKIKITVPAGELEYKILDIK